MKKIASEIIHKKKLFLRNKVIAIINWVKTLARHLKFMDLTRSIYVTALNNNKSFSKKKTIRRRKLLQKIISLSRWVFTLHLSSRLFLCIFISQRISLSLKQWVTLSMSLITRLHPTDSKINLNSIKSQKHHRLTVVLNAPKVLLQTRPL